MSDAPVTVAIPTWLGRGHLQNCLDALRAQRFSLTGCEVLVFDNGADRRLPHWLARSHPGVRLLGGNGNLGFAAACNRMANAASAKIVVFLNDDTRPEPDWLGELYEAIRTAPHDVTAVSGVMLDWQGVRVDFAEGVVTFDGHGLQCGHGSPVADVRLPAPGSELPFACGGNMAVRRDRFLEVGGFDESFFAYLEDVDLGWRLWQRGHRVTAAPAAIVRHRMAGSSGRLGNHHRARLFELNAFRVACKNYEEELWQHIEPLVVTTLASRALHLLRGHQGGAAPESRWQRRTSLATLGRALQQATGALGGRLVRLYPWPLLWVSDERAIAQLEILEQALGDPTLRAGRQQVQAQRVRPDAEIFARFPRYIVPTYPGDEALFATQGMRARLPEELAAREVTLDQLYAGLK